MAEQGRYDRDSSRGGRRDDDDGFGRGGYDRGDQERGRRSDSLFGSGWSEREERGWGSSSDRPLGDRMSSGRGGSDDRDRDDRERGRASSPSGGAERDRGGGGGGGISSWFGGGDRSERSGRDADRDRSDRGRTHDDDEYRPAVVYKDRTPTGRESRVPSSDRERVPLTRDHRSSEVDRDRDRDRARDRDHDHDRDRDRDRDGDRDRLALAGGHRSPDADRDRDRGREDQGYGADDQGGGLPINETERLIASNKVEGTAVYGLDGERLGSIYNFMVEKIAGKVEYAVMTYGGFLGMGTRYYPLPWQLLKYDTRRGGYRIDLTSRDLERAPSFDRSNEPNFDRNYGERVHSWYGLNYK